jgi:hypothetical protein
MYMLYRELSKLSNSTDDDTLVTPQRPAPQPPAVQQQAQSPKSPPGSTSTAIGALSEPVLQCRFSDTRLDDW